MTLLPSDLIRGSAPRAATAAARKPALGLDQKVATGTPEDIVKVKRVSLQPSGLTRGYTGAFLKPVLAHARRSRERDGGDEAEAAE